MRARHRLEHRVRPERRSSLVVPTTGNDIARVDHTDGSLVWSASRIIPNTGAEGFAIFGGTLYGFEGTITTPKVLTAWDLETGAKRYSSPALPGDGDQENPITVGLDGTVYVKRDGGRLYALTDTGSAIVEKWSTDVGTLTYSGHFGIGNDGSIYVPDGDVIRRLNPDDGTVLDSSFPLVTSSTPINPRFAVDGNGTVFVGNSGGSDGRLYALDPDLTEQWSRAVPSMVYGGPALGENGALVVAGGGTFLEVFRTSPSAAPQPPLLAGSDASLQLQSWPNPFTERCSIRFELDRETELSIVAYDASGRQVESIWEGRVGAGSHTVDWAPAERESFSSSVVFLEVSTDQARSTLRVTHVR